VRTLKRRVNVPGLGSPILQKSFRPVGASISSLIEHVPFMVFSASREQEIQLSVIKMIVTSGSRLPLQDRRLQRLN
jgi:hypothetical protein